MRAGRTSEANSQSLPLVQTECASCCLLGTTNTHHSCVQHAAAVRQAKSGLVSNILKKVGLERHYGIYRELVVNSSAHQLRVKDN